MADAPSGATATAICLSGEKFSERKQNKESIPSLPRSSKPKSLRSMLLRYKDRANAGLMWVLTRSAKQDLCKTSLVEREASSRFASTGSREVGSIKRDMRRAPPLSASRYLPAYSRYR